MGCAVAAAPSLDVSYEVTPSSVNPGGSAQIIVNIENEDTSRSIKDLEVELVSRSSGIIITSGTAELGSLGPASTSSAAFSVRIASSVSPGTYTVEARGSYGYGTTNTSSFRINIPITVSYRSNLAIYAHDTQITPGGTGKMLITIENSGRSTIRDLVVTLSPSSTYVYPVGEVRSTISSIGPGESIEKTFEIRASDSAIVGIQPITVGVTYTDVSGTTQVDSQAVAVTIVSPGTEIVIDSIESDLEPGKTGKVRIGVKNVGDVKLENLYFSLNTGEGVHIRGSNEKLIDSLEKGETKYVEFEFDVDQDAEALPVESTLSITYQREGGKKQITETKPLGIVVSGDVDLRLIDVDVDKEDKIMEVDIANYGNKEANAVRVEIIEDGKTISRGFVDKIDINKHKIFRFDLPTQRDITARISYKDYGKPNGSAVVEEEIHLRSDQILQEESPLPLLVIVIVVVVALWWYLRKKRKAKPKIDISKYK